MEIGKRAGGEAGAGMGTSDTPVDFGERRSR